MPVVTSYRSVAKLARILTVLDLIGAHVSSKLQLFASDERTLTDEICDMFYIWNQREDLEPGSDHSAPSLQRWVTVTIAKSTQQKESRFGYDLGMRLTTPEGVKYAIIQAKVFDPVDDKLRCDSKEGWEDLASQLILMRTWVWSWKNDLAFLAIYVPRSKLGLKNHRFGTYEMWVPFRGLPSTTKDPKFGVTLIPFKKLMTEGYAWREGRPHVRYAGDGEFEPAGICFSQLLIDMILCRKGVWLPPWVFPDDGSGPSADAQHGFPFNYTPYREIRLSLEGMSNDQWDEFRNALAREIPEAPDERTND